jgi:DNA-binding CsgD family transcriptional regulator
MPFRRSQGAERTALLLIDDPEKKRPGLSRHVRALYGFTKAEAELALAMTQGLSPDQYAALRDIRITTVRTQIRSMLEKCGITRQIDLVAALVQIPALAPGTEAESGDD